MPANNKYVKEHFKSIYTESVLPKPMSPAYWVSGVSYREITRIKMTCGGGMGGSVWYEYVNRIPLKDLASFDKMCMTVRRWDGKEILLNRSYMVKAEQFTIASAVLRSQNSNFPLGDYTYCFLVEDGHKITLSDACRPL